jgi:hypothetical protein
MGDFNLPMRPTRATANAFRPSPTPPPSAERDTYIVSIPPLPSSPSPDACSWRPSRTDVQGRLREGDAGLTPRPPPGPPARGRQPDQ